MSQNDNHPEVIPNRDIRVLTASEQEDKGPTEREERRNSRDPEERRNLKPDDEEDDSETQRQKDLNTETPIQPDEIDGRTRHIPGAGVAIPELGCANTRRFPPTDLTSQAEKKDLILKEIRESQAAIESRLDNNILKDDRSKMSDKIKTNEQAISTLIPEQIEHASQLDTLRLRLKKLQDHTDDAEGRARRNNVQILGVPEGVQSRNPSKYIKVCRNGEGALGSR
ncbi:hypothetical protein NDU88_003587 [Pleurodeles waltl]|uniref:Uncharacterized protein n=1 Tax=Pleurodeles waltl TaxID=8319 RepID=A0AAV7RIX8_PLEWA|nr:hypothetical protein NDU88_003587 [Pleurodeles waltl]